MSNDTYDTPLAAAERECDKWTTKYCAVLSNPRATLDQLFRAEAKMQKAQKALAAARRAAETEAAR